MNKQKSPLISLVIPVYNAEAFLEQTLDSLLRQTFADFELICVDDGSSDGSLALLHRYAHTDRRIRVFSQTNQGASAARNFGMKHMRGKYAQILDADDFFDPDMLQTLLDRARQTDADVVACRSRHYNNLTGETTLTEWTLRTYLLPEKDVFNFNDIPDHIFQWTIGWAWDKFYKTSFLRKHSLEFQNLHATNDLFFTLKSLACAGKIAVVPRYLITHRTHVGTSVSNTREKAPLCFYRAFVALRQSLCEQGTYELLRQSFANAALTLSLWHLNTVKGKAKKTIYQAFRNYLIHDLDLDNHPETYFYNKDQYLQLQDIKRTSWLRLRLRRFRHWFGTEKADGKRCFWILGLRLSFNRFTCFVRETGRRWRRSLQKRFYTRATPLAKQYYMLGKKFERPWPRSRALSPSSLYVGIQNGEGIGDCLEESPLLALLAAMLPAGSELDYFCRAPKFLEGTPWITRIFPFSRPRNIQDYDIFLGTRRLWTVMHCDWAKLKRLAPRLHDALQKLHRFNANIFDNYALINQLGELYGKNRREQQDLFGDFGLHRDMRPHCAWNDEAFGVLNKYGLKPGRYLTLSRAADSNYNPNHAKLWPLEYFETLCTLLKRRFPELQLVQLGAEERYGKLQNADLVLIGQTTPDEAKVLLKYALLHIDNDGGLSHLRWATNGKSLIFWGPTSLDNVGYESNINLTAGLCRPCAYLTRSWPSCPKGTQACMKAILPETAADAAEKYLKNLKIQKVSAEPLASLPEEQAFAKEKAEWTEFFIGPSSQRLGLFRYDGQANAQQAETAFCYNVRHADGRLDCIVCRRKFEGPMPEEFLKENLRLLRPGGELFIPGDMKNAAEKFTGQTLPQATWFKLHYE